MPRLVYSLQFETEREAGQPIIEFIVPLDRRGNCVGPLLPIGSRAAWTYGPAIPSSTARRRGRTSSRRYRRIGRIR